MGLCKVFASIPSAPTGLGVVITSDSSLTLSWTNTDLQSSTEIYVDGVLSVTKNPGVASTSVTGLTRATNYTFTAKHIRNGIRGPVSSGVVGRPVMAASGGTVTDSGGFRYHVFTTNGNITLNYQGQVSYRGIGRGGPGGAGFDSSGADHGGGGGAAGAYFFANDTTEPAGVYPVQVGTISNSGHTTYRAEDAAPGTGGADADAITGGNGGSNGVWSGGSGFAAGVGNSAAGGGGAGAASSGQNGVLSGGFGGDGVVFPLVGTVGQGGVGGRGSGDGEAATTYGSGGEGGNAGGVDGGAGFQGIFILWYPL